MKIKIDEVDLMPIRAHSTDAGLDLRAGNSAWVLEGKSVIFDTKVHVELPKGTCGLIISRSGLNVKHGLICTGLIDEGYTGEIKVRLFNFGDYDFYIHEGDRIAQLVVIPCIYEAVEIADELEASERGNNGFGSTGR